MRTFIKLFFKTLAVFAWVRLEAGSCAHNRLSYLFLELARNHFNCRVYSVLRAPAQKLRLKANVCPTNIDKVECKSQQRHKGRLSDWQFGQTRGDNAYCRAKQYFCDWCEITSVQFRSARRCSLNDRVCNEHERQGRTSRNLSVAVPFVVPAKNL